MKYFKLKRRIAQLENEVKILKQIPLTQIAESLKQIDSDKSRKT